MVQVVGLVERVAIVQVLANANLVLLGIFSEAVTNARVVLVGITVIVLLVQHHLALLVMMVIFCKAGGAKGIIVVQVIINFKRLALANLLINLCCDEFFNFIS